MSDQDSEPMDEFGDPSVPTELLDLHVQLEEAGVTPVAFKSLVEEGFLDDDGE